MARQLDVTRLAEGDLIRIVDSIRTRKSVQTANRWSLMLRNAILELVLSAETHPEAHEAATLGKDLRMRLVGKRPHVYRILFSFNSERISIHRVRHAAQDWLREDEL